MLDSSSNLESAIVPPEAMSVGSNEDMGFTYRTPSPAREDYLSSGNENSPQGQREPSLDLVNPFTHATEEPQTPVSKRPMSHWHGLLSPETPRFGDAFSGAGSAASSGRELLQPSSETNDAFDETQTSTSTQSLPSQLQSTQQSRCVSSDIPEELTVLTVKTAPDGEVVVPQEEGTDRDAELAHELEATLSPGLVRRSTRISAKSRSKATLEPAVPPPQKTSKIVNAVQPSAQPEVSIVPFKVQPIPFHGLPSLHSVDWDLQYPPGGSTHASYPYPSLDPRLIFHENLIPVSDGLPDISKVPRLVLPMGWTHVSWSGLVPIAFDPYRQAFKLTPVGPMPLTCEELHQGGLHKYVPGGQLHPETAYLPQMMPLSDGSDAEIYNWEGVDWVLPWVEAGGFDAQSIPTTAITDGVSGSTALQITSPAPPIIVHPWREGRDCPDMIFDLSDAFRWLAEKEQHPDTDYVPSPNKQWRGTGAFRSNRKLKSPIAELMMLAIRSTLSAPGENPLQMLQNQDAREPRKNNLFCPFKSVATPMSVDITLLADTEFTIKELLCYFPLHFNWGHAADRLVRAGITPSRVRDMINMTRGLIGEAALKISVVSSAIAVARKRDLVKIENMGEAEDQDTSRELANEEVTTSYTAEGWTYDVWEKIDYPLLALAHGLEDLPTGPDAGPITELIQWCRQKSRFTVLISDVPMLLKEAGIEPLIEPSEEGCPDKMVVPRHAQALKRDQKRVRKTLTEKKRELEDGENGKDKRRRME